MVKKTLCTASLILLSVFFISCGKENLNPQENSNGSSNVVIENADNKENPKEDKNDTKPKSEKKTVRLFFFDMEKMETYYVDEEVVVTDGALITAITSAIQNYNENENFVTLTKKVGVSKAKIEDGILKVYLNDDFTKHMNLGSSSEGALISTLVNSYGYNLKVDKVAVYCNNELYTGLRGELPEGYYTVDYSNTTQYNK
ncbi:MAG: GerMN domain-containing protein [Clostridium sp.]